MRQRTGPPADSRGTRLAVVTVTTPPPPNERVSFALVLVQREQAGVRGRSRQYRDQICTAAIPAPLQLRVTDRLSTDEVSGRFGRTAFAGRQDTTGWAYIVCNPSRFQGKSV